MLTRGRAGVVHFTHINRVFRAVEQWERDRDSIGRLLQQRRFQVIGTIIAEIRESQALSGATNRYEYSWIEQSFDASLSPINYADKSAGLTSTISADNFAEAALNMAEWEANGIGAPVRDGEIVVMYLVRAIKDNTADTQRGTLQYLFYSQTPTCYAAKVTARSAATNATYSAQAYSDSAIAVAAATPINRLFSTASFTFNAAAVNDPCIILVKADGTLALVILTETITVSSCPA